MILSINIDMSRHLHTINGECFSQSQSRGSELVRQQPGVAAGVAVPCGVALDTGRVKQPSQVPVPVCASD